MFIQTEDTPNPDTIKFFPGQQVVDRAIAGVEFAQGQDALAFPLAQALLALHGVKSVFLAQDYVAVTREQGRAWPTLHAPVLTAIAQHFMKTPQAQAAQALPRADEMAKGCPAMDAQIPGQSATQQVDPNTDPNADIVRQIEALIDQRVRPVVAMDGGDIAFNRYEDGVVYVHLRGACAGCPGATATLKMGVERLLRHFIPEVKEVRKEG